MRVRVVIALGDVVQSKNGPFIARDGEADGVRPGGIGEARTATAGVPEIAAALAVGGIRQPWIGRERVACAAPGAAQRQHGALRIARIHTRDARLEKGARHWEVS